MPRVALFCLVAFFGAFAQPPGLREAVAAMQRGEFPAAERQLRSQVAAHPDDALALSLLGVTLDNLKRITEAATELVGATYGALGVLSPDGTHLSSFVTVGIEEELAADIGELPKGHGILGLLIVRPEPLRLDDLR